MLKINLSLFIVGLFSFVAFAETNPVPAALSFTVEGVTLTTPIRRMNAEQFLQQSVMYTPKDVVHDGLPWFGAARDDWMPNARTRRHTGIDVFADSMLVVAAADGEVTTVGRGQNSGGNVTIRHANNVQTMYVHLTRITTFEGATVNAGDVIGVITEPEGNAYETHLHWSIKVNGGFVDPIKYLKNSQGSDPKIKSLLDTYDRGKADRTRARDVLVSRALQKK